VTQTTVVTTGDPRLTSRTVKAATTVPQASLAGLAVIDGYQTVDGDRILIMGQSTSSTRGVWVVHTGVWTRPTDFATGADAQGAVVWVQGGDTLAGNAYQLAGASPVVVDTTAQTWKMVARGDPDNTYARSVRGRVAIVTDDGLWSTKVVESIMARIGARFTSALWTNTIDSDALHLTSADIREMDARGIVEFTAHTLSHPNLTTLTAAQIATEYTAKDVIEGIIGRGKVTTHVYPVSASNPLTDQLAWGRFDHVLTSTADLNAASGGQYLYDRLAPKPFKLNRVGWTSANDPATRAIVTQAALGGFDLFLYTHDLDNLNFTNGVTRAQFESMVQLIRSLGMEFVTVSEMCPPMQTAIPNPVFDDGLYRWAWTNDPGLTVEVVVDAPPSGFPGTRSLHMVSTDATKTYYAWPEKMIVEQNLPYTGSAQARCIRTGGTGGIGLRMDEYKADDEYVSFNDPAALTTPAAWTQVTRARTPVTGSVMFPRATMKNMTGEAWFTHFYMGPTADGVLG
jgi:peptidoglycan/xylan/chitin deacetylase (PgdA/CDA1 family)